jgi:transposase-like protein
LQPLLERKRQEIIATQRLCSNQPPVTSQNEAVEKVGVEPASSRQQLLQRIKEMHAGGKTLRAIAKELDISRNTVRKYVRLHEPPKKKGNKVVNLDRYNEYLGARMNEDHKVEVLQLFKEIKAQGYNGGRTSLYEYLKAFGKHQSSHQSASLPVVPRSLNY